MEETTQSIQVICRIRPSFGSMGRDRRVVSREEDSVRVQCGPSLRSFHYDNVIDSDMTQEDVFQACGKQITNNVIEGYNG